MTTLALSDISSCICHSTGQLNEGMGMTGNKYGLNNNLTSSILPGGQTDWNSIDQRQRIIQNVVRVPASQYTVNISALNVFDPSQNSGETGSNFSGPSDRGYPSGYMNYSMSSNKPNGRPGTSVTTTSNVNTHGVDVKHNSYARYLAKKKGAGSARSGYYSSSSQASNRATALYGGKNVMFSIVRGNCNCVTAP